MLRKRGPAEGGSATKPTRQSGVESRRGAVTYRTGGAHSSRSLSRPTSPSGPSFRFHIPLVEPDGRFSRIRLSDKVSCVRPWEVVGEGLQPNQTQRSVEVLVGEPRDSPSPHLVLATQPPAELIPGVCIHRPVRFAHRPETEVVRPTAQHVVEALYTISNVGLRPSRGGLLADRPAQPCDPLP